MNFSSENESGGIYRQMMVFGGTAHRQLAQNIAVRLNLPLGQANIDRFSDGEAHIEIAENVRGKDVFIVQPTCAPADTNLMELLLMVDAVRRSSATGSRR